MKKKEIIIIISLFLISGIYHFIIPSQKVEEVVENKEIVIIVEGKYQEKLYFQKVPTVMDILTYYQLENEYNYNINRTLEHNQTFYIPSQKSETSINISDYQTLLLLPGVGPVMANKIIEYRDRTKFETFEDLMNISGVGYKTYLSLRELVCL